MSFETILLDCIMTAVISACIFKKVSKLVIFCAAILMLKMEEDMPHFGILHFINSRKVKTHWNKKSFVVFGDGAVTDGMCHK